MGVGEHPRLGPLPCLPCRGRSRAQERSAPWSRSAGEACALGLRRRRVSGLRQSEREAYQFILDFLEEEYMSEATKLQFLRAVGTLSGAVHAQAEGDMSEYCSKAILAKKTEKFILQESTEVLTSNVRQQAMLCIVALSQVKPPFYLSEKLDLVNTCVFSTFSLPPILPSLDRKESASLYLQTVQALDDMLQVLVMDDMDPNMLILQSFLEIILPWSLLSDKVHEKTRALGTISRLLRFICNFPRLLHMTEFSMSGRLMGIFGLFCMDPNQEISMEASEALHYLFKILVLQRSSKPKTEIILQDLQKHFRGEWFASMQDITLFFKKYLTPNERADMIMVAMEAMTGAGSHDICAASKMLKMILKYTIPEIGKVPEIIRYLYHHMNSITEITAQTTVKKILYLLAQSYTDEVILTLFKMEDQSQKGVHKPWEILASFPKGYEVIMEYLLQRLTPYQQSRVQEPSCRTAISPLIATRAIHELLLEPSRRIEVQTFFSPLFLALLFQVSCFVIEGVAETVQDPDHVTEWVDPISSTVEALQTLMRSSGYADHVSSIQQLGGWGLLTNPERHYDGVTLVARSLVINGCWHNRPIFGLIVRILQDPGCRNHRTALVLLTELLQCPDVAAMVDNVATHILASWFQTEELATVKLLLQLTEAYAKDENMVRHLHILQPYVLNCCCSSNSDIVVDTLLMLKDLLSHLTWKYSSSFLLQLTFTLVPFFEEHQVLNLIIVLVLHLQDANISVALVRGPALEPGPMPVFLTRRLLVSQICQSALCHIAALLGWSKLKAVFSEKDVWTILGALLEQEASKALWFLKQTVSLLKSPQAPIRRAAVWFAGQIIQTLDLEEIDEIEEAHAALRYMQRDPDPMVSCLTTQTFYVLEAKKKMLPVRTPTSCFCRRKSQRSHF
ncbi:PREDICTED: maestro heat-like repeat-containing protein family member 7 [Propithecus coquereli]|uniref:maestro heat-like repeat-containing protein family member 7 n=1 Tax=Propithecus coquereli TaxID=379532 RepID=UPI00063F8ACC|nr:PREDICTED: maestro heat-like repeat-containing protein family member 7 [Propithecus coquereli]